jgi:hypothetical protein
MGTRLGTLSRVNNSSKKSSENSEYVCVWVKDSAGAYPLLFTEEQISNAIHRAKKNPEDVTERCLISKILD